MRQTLRTSLKGLWLDDADASRRLAGELLAGVTRSQGGHPLA